MIVLDRSQTSRGDVREFFRNDSRLVAYWPLKVNGLDYVGGNHMNLTNVIFQSGAAYFNGVNAFGSTSQTLNLTSTDKLTVLFRIMFVNYDLINQKFILEHGNFSLAPNVFNIQNQGVAANDPLRIVDVDAGSLQVNYDYISSQTNLQNKNKTDIAVTYDRALADNTIKYYQNAIFLTPVKTQNQNTIGNYANSVLFLASRGGLSGFSNIYLYDLAVFSRVLSPREIYEYYQWSNNLTNKSMQTMLDY